MTPDQGVRGFCAKNQAWEMGDMRWPVIAAVLVSGLAWFLSMTAFTMAFPTPGIVWVGLPWGVWLTVRLGRRLGFTGRAEFAVWAGVMAAALGATAAGLWHNAPAGGSWPG